jgi:hypothetical protein
MRVFHIRTRLSFFRVASIGGVMCIATIQAAAQDCDAQDVFNTPTPVLSFSAIGSQTILQDWDGDGDLDAVIGRGINGVGSNVFFNSGEGVFVPGPSLPNGIGFLVIRDLNGDGFLDFAAADFTSAVVRVRFNQGDDTFAGEVFYPTGGSPTFIVLEDFDGDGDLDIVTANNASGTITVWLNNGSGVFSGRQDYPAGTGPNQIAAADLDGDGDLDLAVTNFSGNAVSVLRNAGGAIFTLQTTIPIGGQGGPVRMADFDGDGRPDLAVGTQGGVTIALNQGGWNFTTASYPAPASREDLDVGDINGDGRPDVVVAGSGTNAFGVLFNNGDGTLGPQANVVTPGAPTSLALGDLNASGALDLLIFEASVSPGAGSRGLVAFNQCLIPVIIAQQPVGLAVNAGQSAQFSVGVDLGTPPIAFQWRRNDQPIVDGPGVSGAQSDTLTLTAVDATDSDHYDVVVSNLIGAKTSQPALLAVRSSDCPFDLNNDGVLNFFDVSAYINGFNAGCP